MKLWDCKWTKKILRIEERVDRRNLISIAGYIIKDRVYDLQKKKKTIQSGRLAISNGTITFKNVVHNWVYLKILLIILKNLQDQDFEKN